MHSNTGVKNLTLEKTQWMDVMVLWVVGIFAAMQFAKFSISYDLLLAAYAVDSASVGVMLSVVGVVGLLFGVVAGVLSGYLGYRNVLLGSLLIGGGLSLLQATLPSYPVLLASRVVEGLSHLGLIVAAPTLMLRSSAAHSHSLVMGLWGTFFGVAFAIAGWLGSQILLQYGVSGMFLAHAFISAPLIVYFLLSPDNHVNTVLKSNAVTLSHLFKSTIQVYLNPRTCLPGVVFLFHTSMFVALLTFVPRLSPDDTTKNLLLILLPLCSIAGTFIAGALSQYFLRPQNLALVAYVGVALATFAVIEFEGIPQYFVVSALSLLVISGMVQGAAFTLIPALSRHESEQAMGNGAIAQLGNLGATIGPPMFAYFIDSNGSQGLLWVVASLCLAGAIVACISRRY